MSPVGVKVLVSPALTYSLAMICCHGDVIKVCDGITSNFYTAGLHLDILLRGGGGGDKKLSI